MWKMGGGGSGETVGVYEGSRVHRDAALSKAVVRQVDSIFWTFFLSSTIPLSHLLPCRKLCQNITTKNSTYFDLTVPAGREPRHN